MALSSGNLTALTEAQAEAVVGTQGDGGWQANGVAVSLRDHANGGSIGKAVVKAAKIVVGGAFFSSGVLLRSPNFPNRRSIGRKIYLQPHAQIFGLFDESVTKAGVIQDGQYVPYNGVPAIYKFLGFLQEHHFWWLASILYPAGLASFVSYLSPSEHLKSCGNITRRWESP